MRSGFVELVSAGGAGPSADGLSDVCEGSGM